MELLAIDELVPFVAGTAQVDILGPNGQVLASVKAGANPPTVKVLSPNGGESLDGDEITVSWEAADADGDPLSFTVQYSPDNGKSWNVVYSSAIDEEDLTALGTGAQSSNAISVVVDAGNFVAGDQGLIRVWASDGVNTVSDQSDGTFRIPNRLPTVMILQPVNGTVIFVEQTLNLEADAYDVDTGSLDDTQVEWTSSLNGFLGNGAQLTTSSLSVGTHMITVRADDGQGGVATASVRVIVRGDLSERGAEKSILPLILR